MAIARDEWIRKMVCNVVEATTLREEALTDTLRTMKHSQIILHRAMRGIMVAAAIRDDDIVAAESRERRTRNAMRTAVAALREVVAE